MNVDGSEVIKDEDLARLEQSIQTVEDVIKFIHTQGLSLGESVVYIMRNSVDVQRIATLQQLHNYLDENEDHLCEMLRALVVVIHKHSPEVQIACAKGVRDVLHLIPPVPLMAAFHALDLVITGLKGQPADEWQTTYIAFVRRMPPEVLEQFTIPFVKRLTVEDQEDKQRVIFGIKLVSEVLDRTPALSEFVIELLQFCANDNNSNVRLAISEQCASISTHLSTLMLREALLPIVLRLLLDPEVRVANACFSSLVDMSPSFDQPTRQLVLLPIFLRFVHNAPPPVQPVVYKEYGKMMWNLRESLEESHLQELIDNYALMCGSTNEGVRQHCAHNLPAIVACGVPYLELHDKLNELIVKMSKDTNAAVRQKIAAGYHEFLNLFGGPWPGMEAVFKSLFVDSDLPVRERLMKHFDVILNGFQQAYTTDRIRAFVLEIAPMIKEYEQSISNNWRKLDILMHHYQRFPQLYTATELLKFFVPSLMKGLSRGASSLRPRLASTMAMFLHYFKTDEEKVLILNACANVVTELSASRSAGARLGYIDFCEAMLEQFSTRFFSHFLLTPLLKLGEDPVPNVKYHLLKMTPRLKAVPSLQASMTAFVSRFVEDKDVDVRKCAIGVTEMNLTFDEKRDRRFEEREGDCYSAEMQKKREAQKEAEKAHAAAAAAAQPQKRQRKAQFASNPTNSPTHRGLR